MASRSFRKFSKIEPRARSHREVAPSQSSKKIKVLSYNMLADAFTNESHAHLNRSRNGKYLEFEPRRRMLQEEILESNADILCLQEVDLKFLNTVWAPFLTSMSYNFVHEGRWNNQGQDCCLVAFKKERFQLQESLHFQHNDLADKLGPEFKRGNVGLACHLTMVEDDGEERDLVVSTTHLHWASFRDYVKYGQIQNTVSHLENFMRGIAGAKGISVIDLPLVLCGDMNSEPDSSVVDFVHGRQLKRSSHVQSDYSQYYDLIQEHFDERSATKRTKPLTNRLVSAYTEYNKGQSPAAKHPDFTCYSRDCQHTIDYIFYTKDALQVHSILEMPSRLHVASLLPNEHFPSDHLRIEATLSLTK